MHAGLHDTDLQYCLLRLRVGHKAISQHKQCSCSEKENTISFSQAFAFQCYLVPVTLELVRQ